MGQFHHEAATVGLPGHSAHVGHQLMVDASPYQSAHQDDGLGRLAAHQTGRQLT